MNDDTPISREEVARVEQRIAALGGERNAFERAPIDRIKFAIAGAIDAGRRAQGSTFTAQFNQIARHYLSIADIYCDLIEQSRQSRRPNTIW